MHQNGVKSIEIDSKMLATCSTDEAAIWSISKTSSSEPMVILNEPATSGTLHSISFAQDNNTVVCLASEQVSLFKISKQAKGTGPAVVACKCRVNLSTSSQGNV